MNKQETIKEINDFIEFNEADINALIKDMPEIGNAFMGVLNTLSKEFGSGEDIILKPIEEKTEVIANKEKDTEFSVGDLVVVENINSFVASIPRYKYLLNGIDTFNVLPALGIRLMVVGYTYSSVKPFSEETQKVAYILMSAETGAPMIFYASIEGQNNHESLRKATDKERNGVMSDKKFIDKPEADANINWFSPITDIFLNMELPTNFVTYAIISSVEMPYWNEVDKKVESVEFGYKSSITSDLKSKMNFDYIVKENKAGLKQKISQYLSAWRPDWKEKKKRPSVQRKASFEQDGAIGMGYDGYLYKVKENKAGVKQWKVFMNYFDDTNASYLTNPIDIKVAIDQLEYAATDTNLDRDDATELNNLIVKLKNKI
jgi:hypothetical protein